MITIGDGEYKPSLIKTYTPGREPSKDELQAFADGVRLIIESLDSSLKTIETCGDNTITTYDYPLEGDNVARVFMDETTLEHKGEVLKRSTKYGVGVNSVELEGEGRGLQLDSEFVVTEKVPLRRGEEALTGIKQDRESVTADGGKTWALVPTPIVAAAKDMVIELMSKDEKGEMDEERYSAAFEELERRTKQKEEMEKIVGKEVYDRYLGSMAVIGKIKNEQLGIADAEES